jgi:purine nucleoside phosphorylase
MKTQPAELIEAYAAARVSNNRMLMEYAAGKLNELLAAIEVAVPKEILDTTKEN